VIQCWAGMAIFRTQNLDADSHLKEYCVTNWLRWILRGAYMECNVTSVLSTNLCNRAIDFGWKKRCYEKSEKRRYKLVLG